MRKTTAYSASLALALATTPFPAFAQISGEADIADNFTVGITELACTAVAGPYPACGWAGPGGGEAKYRQNCDASHNNKDDSILFPGLPGGAPHAHTYFGNTVSDGNSTYTTLRTTGDGTCPGLRLNRSSYWHPAMFTNDAETRIKMPDYVLAYYSYDSRVLAGSGDAVENLDVEAPFPNGLSMIGGAKPLDPNYYTTQFANVTLGSGQTWNSFNGIVGWSCLAANGTNSPTYATLDDPALTCQVGDQMQISLNMPDCWAGDSISSANGRTHVIYAPRREANVADCPPTHPYSIARLETRAHFSVNRTNEHRDWHLSSDRQSSNPANWQADGSTWHLDWREAWSTVARKRLQRNCNQLTIDSVAPASSNSSCSGGNQGGGYLGQNPITAVFTLETENLKVVPQALRASVTDISSSVSRLKLRFRRR